MSSFLTHRDAMLKILGERTRDLQHHKDYFTSRVTRLRELKLRQALGEAKIWVDSWDRPIFQVIETEQRQLRYAIECIRRSRRRLWEVYALQNKQRVREYPHD